MRHPDQDGKRGWTWDQSLYGGSAPFYAAGRLPYAPELAGALRRALDLDGSGRLLDVGTGPGVVALELASLFDGVVGIDADAEMIAEAQREADRREIVHARWAVMRAEDLPADLGSFRLVTFAQSFHWTERGLVARAVREMLEPAGALVLISGYTRTGVDVDPSVEYPVVPRRAIDELVTRYLGSVRRAGAGSLPDGTPSDEEAVLADAGFTAPDDLVVPDDRLFTRSIDQVVAGVYSVSSSAPHLFGDRLASFDADLRRVLRETSTGPFAEQAAPTHVRIFRRVADA